MSKYRGQVATPFTQSITGAKFSAFAAAARPFTVDGAASDGKITLSGAAKQIEILTTTNFILVPDATIYAEISEVPLAGESVTVTAATNANGLPLFANNHYNYELFKGQKISVFGTGNLYLIPCKQ